MTRKLFVWSAAAALAMGAAVSAAAADDKPNFSGSWKLNADKSDFGMIPKPDKLEQTIDHKDPELKVKTLQVNQMGERTTESTYKTDGSESVNKQGPAEVKSVVKWEGKVLTLTSKREVQGMEITINQRWSLSEDGKVITVDSKVNTPQGDLDMKQVLDKQ